MSDLVGIPEDRFFHNEARIVGFLMQLLVCASEVKVFLSHSVLSKQLYVMLYGEVYSIWALNSKNNGQNVYCADSLADLCLNW